MSDLQARAAKVAELSAKAIPGRWVASVQAGTGAVYAKVHAVGIPGEARGQVLICRTSGRTGFRESAALISATPDMAVLIADQQARIAELEVSHARYEYVRRLDPQSFSDLWIEALNGVLTFDAVVDIARSMK